MNWGWFSTAAVGGILTELGRRLLDIGETWFKSHTEERRTIRAEERERANKEADRKREQAETVERDDACLLAYKTRLKGCSEWAEAVDIVSTIHRYLDQRPRYLEISSNRDFLIKYPNLGAPGEDQEQWLADLKRDADTLRVEGGRR
jgi:phage-related minor tail protein